LTLGLPLMRFSMPTSYFWRKSVNAGPSAIANPFSSETLAFFALWSRHACRCSSMMAS
jgi:hypothetical protein